MDTRNTSFDQPSCVLLCGKTELLDYETLEQISQYYNVVVTGHNTVVPSRLAKRTTKIHLYEDDITSANFRKLVHSYTPDAIWYFSGFADGGEGFADEYRKIEDIYAVAVTNEVSKVIVISSINSLNYKVSIDEDHASDKHYITQKAFDCAKMEELASYCASANMIKTIKIRTPYIINKNNKGTYFGTLFEKIINNKSIELPYNEKQKIDLLSDRNLAEVLIAITEETMDKTDEYTVLSDYEHTYAELGEVISECRKDQEVSFSDSFYDLVLNRKAEGERVRKSYGFITAKDAFEDIKTRYDQYNRSVVKKSEFKEKAGKILKKFSGNTYKVLELVILFVLVQLLLSHTTDSVFFKYVDLRLFFVVVLGITHGMFVGIIAGIMQCISLIVSYSHEGVSGTTLFYNMDYWLPFAIYLMTGAITGYLTSTKNRKLEFASEEIETIQEKYLFLNNVYMSVIDNKEEYKRQILGYQDSFGKIFEAVEKLDSSITADIFMNGVDTLERILNNHSIAIYTMDEYQKYGRLVACSREMVDSLRKSISIDEFREVYDTILERDTWKNTDFKENLPMYSYAIVENNKVRLMISIYDVLPEQVGLYYMNLFTIMCHLIRVSFVRALEYQNAIEDEKYFKNTDVLMPEYYEQELESQRRMSDSGMASYILLKLVDNDVEKVDKKLQGLIRHSDIVGKSSDGNCYLLLTQINKDILKIIGERLDTSGVSYSIVEGM